MTTNINDIGTRSHLIAGVEMGPAAADSTGFEEDYKDAPYSQIPLVTDMPFTNSWQKVLGLGHQSPAPSQLDPPPRPSGIGGEFRTDGSATLVSVSDLQSRNSKSSVSPKVKHMADLLADYDRMTRRLRTRGSEGANK